MPDGGVTKSFGMYPWITRAATCELGHGEGPRQRYLRSAFDATLHRWVPIDDLGRDPTRCDLVVMGAPVFGWRLSACVRAFLSNMRHRAAVPSDA